MSSSPSPVDFEQLTPVASAEPAPSLETAAVKARALVAAAEAEAERIRSEAFAAGHAAGFAAGRTEAAASLAPTATAIASVLEDVRRHEAELSDRVESQAVELAVQVAERVVAASIEASPSRVLDVVRGALRTMVERERVTVLVNPEDLALIRDALPDLEVHEERRVSRGGAIVRTSLGEVDASVETKLARAREALLEELARS
jgi:flagellar assembly protein FliH